MRPSLLTKTEVVPEPVRPAESRPERQPLGRRGNDQGSGEEPGVVYPSPHRSWQKSRVPVEATSSKHRGDLEKLKEEPEPLERESNRAQMKVVLSRLYQLCNYSGGVEGQEVQGTSVQKEGKGLSRTEMEETGEAHLETLQTTFPQEPTVPDQEQAATNRDAPEGAEVEKSTRGQEELAPGRGQAGEETTPEAVQVGEETTPETVQAGE